MSELEERLHALYLLSQFIYFGIREVRALLQALYRDLYRYPIISQLRRAQGDTTDAALLKPAFEERLRRTRFIGVGNPSESGTHLLYYFRQENRLSKDLFIPTDQIFSLHERTDGTTEARLRDSKVERYIFIDDFCGSGDQVRDYTADTVKNIKRLNPNARTAYYSLMATTRGLKR